MKMFVIIYTTSICHEWAKGELTEITRFAMKLNATDLINISLSREIVCVGDQKRWVVPLFYWAMTSQAHALLQASTKESESGAQ